MYSIGEFSRINRITPKALRHYDRIGLLKPAKIDEWTGYRFYAPQQLPEVTVASMRTTVPNYDAFFEVVPRMGEYMASVGAVCREPEYCFTIFHNDEFREEDIDVEICEAVEEAKEESEMVQFRTVPGVTTAACISHRGPYSTLGESYNALFSWIEANSFAAADHPRESYIDGIWNRENPADWLTEVQVPVTPMEQST